jgi:DNA mismatch repair protein MutL
MPDIIKLLPDSIANKIAAGEVVQRPASVVKELLENSLDAGSSQITLIVKEAGKTLIQVVDNGSGMTGTDARMCFERHATSKIEAAEDLFRLKTMGFRGEAMASIAAVAQVELKTRRHEDELGTLILIDGAEFKETHPISTPAGTSITVKNLFYNIPARRNFLKSNPIELRHILEEFQRIALSRPEITFRLFQNDLETYHLPATNLSQRIVGLFGDAYRAEMAVCKEENDYVRINGLLGTPETAKKIRGEQYLYANQRFIKHGYLHHAIVQAYQHLLGPEMHPFYVLFLEIDPSRIDVNVHPTKTEVKFDDERGLYALVQSAIKRALNENQMLPAIDFERDVNFFDRMQGNMPEERRVLSRAWANAETGSSSVDKAMVWPFKKEHIPAGWEKAYTSSETENAIPQASIGDKQELFQQRESQERNTFQVHDRYIITQIRSGVVIIDQNLAHQRVLYEKFLGLLEKRFTASQQFLFPQTIELNAADFELIMEMEQELRYLGFVFSHFGKNTIVVNGIPSDLSLRPGHEKDIFEGLIEQYKTQQQQLKVNKKDALARSLAKKAALKPGSRLSVAEMNSLIDQLFACQSPQFAPGGQPTVRTISLDQLSAFFEKKSTDGI